MIYPTNGDVFVWGLVLNKYQRDNLLFLLNIIGYGAEPIEPFNLLNTGDWVGEIALALSKPIGDFHLGRESITIQDDDRPNISREYLITLIKQWENRKGVM